MFDHPIRRGTRGMRRGALISLVTITSLVAVPAAAAAHDHDPDQSQEQDQSHDQKHEQDSTHIERHGDQELAVHDCSGRNTPSAKDEENAEELIAAVTADIAQYRDLAVAEEEGYRITDEAAQSPSPIDHYMSSGPGTTRGGEMLDTDHPSGLVYFQDDDGSIELLGAVWRSREECPPQPAGPLTVWHDHSPSGCPAAHPDCPAATGEGDAARVPKMFHVWIYEGVEEPFAHDLPGALGHSGHDGHAGERTPGERPRLPFDDD